MNETTPKPLPPVTAVILAGGSGSRLGGIDKAMLSWRGRSFLESIIDHLTPQAAEILINSNRTAGYPGIALPVIADPWPDQRGPLAGVLAGLEAARNDWVLFVPCDSPQPAADLAQRLFAAIGNDTDIAYAGTGSDNHYLFCLIRRSLHPHLRNYLQEGGRAVHRWLATQSSQRVAFDDETDAFLNINSSSELNALQSIR